MPPVVFQSFWSSFCTCHVSFLSFSASRRAACKCRPEWRPSSLTSGAGEVVATAVTDPRPEDPAPLPAAPRAVSAKVLVSRQSTSGRTKIAGGGLLGATDDRTTVRTAVLQPLNLGAHLRAVTVRPPCRLPSPAGSTPSYGPQRRNRRRTLIRYRTADERPPPRVVGKGARRPAWLERENRMTVWAE